MRSLFVLTCLVFVASSACSKRVDELPASDYKPSTGTPLPPGPDTLEKVDERVGTGAEAKSGDKVKVNYTGTLMNGKEFDSSVGKDPFSFTLGQGQVIKGWDEGVVGMKVGGKRKLTIPWKLAYGEAGSGDKIPPKAALKFDVELLEIEGAAGTDAGKSNAGKPAASSSAAAKTAPDAGKKK